MSWRQREGNKEAEAEHRARLDQLIEETPNQEDLKKIYEDERKAQEKWETSKKMIDANAEGIARGYKKYKENGTDGDGFIIRIRLKIDRKC